MRVTLSLLLAFVMSLLSSQLYCQGRWDDYDEYSPEDSLTTTHIRLFPRGGHRPVSPTFFYVESHLKFL